jgi:Domain of unknown function (DUF4178)
VSPAQVACPGCGGPITFKIGSSIVAVCPYCRSVVARGDRSVEDLGKVAALVESGSLLSVGMKGRYRDVPFELTGRAQLGHPAGGQWDEWYAAFADGRWGWIAEAQGRFYVTFREVHADPTRVPAFADLHAGSTVSPVRNGPPLTVAEKAQATYLSAEGEIPYRLEPGKTYLYADLSGAHGEFGTLDYSESEPLVFLGGEATLDDLGVPATARPREDDSHRVEGIQVSCPQCGGALDLKAPDRTERVGCPNCGALLDCQQGRLRFLQALKFKVRQDLPLGAVGRFENQDFVIVGFLVRSVTIAHVKYFWHEYLLYHLRLGFRWLVCSDHHWSYVRPLAPGAVHARGTAAEYESRSFQLFQRARASVEHVRGECYWKVTVGEMVEATDYVRPPEMLSREASREEGQEEVNWSLGEYVPVENIEAIFKVNGLPRPTTIAPNQPFPYWSLYRYWAVLTGAAVVVFLFFLLAFPERKVYEQTIQLLRQPSQEVFSDHFHLRGSSHVKITARADGLEPGGMITGELVNDNSARVAAFSLPLVAGQGDNTSLSAPVEGTYSLKLDFYRPTNYQPETVVMQVRQGGGRPGYLFLTLLVLSIIPGLVIVYQISFEARRWQDSNVR